MNTSIYLYIILFHFLVLFSFDDFRTRYLHFCLSIWLGIGEYMYSPHCQFWAPSFVLYYALENTKGDHNPRARKIYIRQINDDLPALR